ncbi:acylneuraminate cytidylyltransferase family protein [Leptospira noumeaensis]|uniref:Acylneuraminate cytidylyltransferase family protein n=1 Tax=Leptospira noumeaensis TaxID=2484964 RepID=A0A4R9HZT4_9LEPT|nr:acylneuraminate cytidylyltransferase family protein [Leptospira noumeaensis]TGK78467.1 acylneuraminate cytidylyltransferase family protein [Leptospira noumeaensis]
MNILAFIPARGGSKGIPGKNLYQIAGNPLLFYTIDLAKKIDKSVIPFLSTDDIEIKAYGRSLGLNDDYLRPKDLASDSSATIDAVMHALEWIQKSSELQVDAVLLLQPTSPIRILSEVQNAIHRFKEKKMESLVSVTLMREHPFECIKSVEESWSFLEKPSEKVTGRQGYTGKYYFLDGSFYLASVDFLKNNKAFVVEGKTKLFESDLRYSIDIDELEDMKIAESILERKLKL